jgi:hypothetical protein
VAVQLLLPLASLPPGLCPMCGFDAPAVARINRRIRYRCQCGQTFEFLASLSRHVHTLDSDKGDELEDDNAPKAKTSHGANRGGLQDVSAWECGSASGVTTPTSQEPSLGK